MGVNCNTGQGSTSKKGMLDGFDLVWVYAKGIANILSFADVKKRALAKLINMKSDKVVLAGDGSINT
eukprot:8371490-Ditylum_brightwellii.AAC.1